MTTLPSGIARAQRLRDQVYQLIRQELRTGVLLPGQRLVEVEVANRLGVSRTPVREALFQLARDGLLVEATRGYVLPVHTVEKVRHHLELRMLLEPAIVRQACLSASSEQIKQLGAAWLNEKKHVKARDPSKFITANMEFRSVLLGLGTNPLLRTCAALYDDQFQGFRIAGLSDVRNRRKISEGHHRLYAAIKARDADAAESEVQNILAWVQETLEREGATSSPASRR